MGILVINEYGKDTREVRLSQPQVLIGRDPRGEIVLEDVGVSRSHARIVRKDSQFVLQDLGSRNGTLVNNEKVPEKGTRPLRNGDVIQVGRSVIQLIVKITQGIANSIRKGSRRRPTIEATRVQMDSCEREAPISLFRLQKLQPFLLIVQEGETPVCHPLKSDRVRVGRNPKSDIVLGDPTVSGNHAEIVYNKEGFHVVDSDSTMGTFLDGVSIQVSSLDHRSFIRFGRVKAMFLLREEELDPPEASFHLRDHLVEIYPERSKGIQRAFQECRENALDIAEELITRGIVDPEEWWSATLHFKEKHSTGPRGIISRLFRRRSS